MFDHEGFSRRLKITLTAYLEGRSTDRQELVDWCQRLSLFNPKVLKTDNEKKAFWINLYNGLTNYFIISNGLRKSVWEVPGFFSELTVQVGEYCLSLDDIEHGILRQNGARRNNKSRQFNKADKRKELMVGVFDPRIHFALNCGSISCPPVAFYSAEKIDQQLALAEDSFAGQEFLPDHENKTIRCSEVFAWYRADFPNTYLNDPALADYTVEVIPYQWIIY